MIYAYLPDGRTEGSRFLPHLCDEHPYSPEERVEAIVAHGAALGLADKAEHVARGTFWSVARARAWLDGLTAPRSVLPPRPGRTATSTPCCAAPARETGGQMASRWRHPPRCRRRRPVPPPRPGSTMWRLKPSLPALGCARAGRTPTSPA